jgi:hypothetical protein
MCSDALDPISLKYTITLQGTLVNSVDKRKKSFNKLFVVFKVWVKKGEG